MATRTKKIFSIHHWCGLFAGMFILMMSLSGCVLVFHEEIDSFFILDKMRLQHPAARISFDASFEEVRRLHPGWDVRIPSMPRDAYAPLRYELRKGNLRKWALAHPETGQILHSVPRADQRFVNVLLTFHYSFFAGTLGKGLVLLVGSTLLVAIVTGVAVYRKWILKVLLLRAGISFTSKRAFYSSAHRVLGVWGLAFNLLIAISGIRMGYLVFSSGLRQAQSEVHVPPITGSIDSLIAHAHDTFPDFKVSYIRFPSENNQPMLLLGHLDADPAYYGKHYSKVTMNCSTGTIAGYSFVRDKPWADRILTILQPLHFGNYAGIGVKMIYAIGGLLPGLLSISGFLVWKLGIGNKGESPRKKKTQTAPPSLRREEKAVL